MEKTYACQQNSNASNHNQERRKGGKRGHAMKLSSDPQSIAARERRHRISDRFRILKSLVPGGSKMDTVSMLEEAIHYVKFLKAQIWLHQAAMMATSDDSLVPLLSTTTAAAAAANANDNASGVWPTSSPSLMSPVVSPLPPLTTLCFQGEEEMLSYVGLNY